jgi:hypothetical protein
MRTLNKLEQKFINQILELDNESDLIYIHNVLSTVYDKKYEIEFYGVGNKLKEIDYYVTLRFKKNTESIPVNKIIGDFISLSYLIEDLLKEGYLVKEKIDDVKGYRYINKFQNRENISEFEIKSNFIKSKFAKNLQYKFFATELLRELKRNKYVTFERKDAKSTKNLAILGIIIALLSLFISIAIPYFSNDSISINKESMDYFIKNERLDK